jgi:hypothetical protein
MNKYALFGFMAVLIAGTSIISGCANNNDNSSFSIVNDEKNITGLQSEIVDCAQDGEKIYGNSNFGPTTCCSNISAIKPTVKMDSEGVCIRIQDGAKGICDESWDLICGDGECNILVENACDCPLDCSAELCKPAGYQYKIDPESRNFFCCEDSQPTSVSEILPDGICVFMQGKGLCSECGNGVCEDWENICNCIEDCS